VFPAIPASWKNISFNSLRAEGAYLVSASMKNGLVDTISIKAEKGGSTTIKIPSRSLKILTQVGVTIVEEKDNFLKAIFKPGAVLKLGN
jgi:alpha-L-fucosidase 2